MGGGILYFFGIFFDITYYSSIHAYRIKIHSHSHSWLNRLQKVIFWGGRRNNFMVLLFLVYDLFFYPLFAPHFFSSCLVSFNLILLITFPTRGQYHGPLGVLMGATR